MPALRIDDVPEDVLAILKKRAEEQGLSLSHYIRTLLIMESEKEDEWTEEAADKLLAQLKAREPVDVTVDEIVAMIRRTRDA